MVEEGTCSNKSEFQRFAVEYVLSKATDHDPDIITFDDIRTEIFAEQTEGEGDIPTAEPTSAGDDTFIQVATRVRQFGRREQIQTAEEYIDTQFLLLTLEAYSSMIFLLRIEINSLMMMSNPLS